jgi:L-ascorbate metabolism protein UlaG (beta-lactamase superfamily)
MKLTKYEHACLTVEKDGQVLVVDPGRYSTDFIAPRNVVAVVVTHAHGDHLDHDMLTTIVDKNQDAIIIGPEDVTKSIEVFQTHTVQAGDTFTVGSFELAFFGGEHALIHKSIPIAANLGVMVNDLLYYPGDSLTLPGRPIDTLAIPAAAPWMKIGEAMDFLIATHPRFAFPTHDAIASPLGKSIVDRLLGAVAKNQGSEYRRLDGSMEI